MDYTEAKAAFFQPRAGAQPINETMPGRRLRDALEPVATIHYWSEPAYQANAANGLDFLTGYVFSRSSVLGEATGPQAADAFGVFEPNAVAGLYDAARDACSLADVQAARLAGAEQALSQAITDPAGAAQVAAALQRGIQAADPAGRPLFAGSAAAAQPESDLGQVWAAATTLRELRGDAHLQVVRAAGLTGLEANILTEAQVGWEPGSYSGSRAWSPEQIQEATAGLQAKGLLDENNQLTDAGRDLRADLEVQTEAALQPTLDAIGADLDLVVDTCQNYGDQILAAGWFPPDPFKRASG